MRFNQTVENYLKVSVGSDTYNLTKHNKIQLTDTTVIKIGKSGGYLLPKQAVKCNDQNGAGKITKFVRAKKVSSLTLESGATSILPIGDSFMYIETSSNSFGKNVFVSWERTDFNQISNMTFYYNRFSILTNNSLKSMCRFRLHLSLEDNTWSTRYNIPKNDQYSNSSTDLTLFSLNFTIETYGVKLIYDER